MPEGRNGGPIPRRRLLCEIGWSEVRATLAAFRHRVAFLSRPAALCSIRLSWREFQITSLAARGYSSKLIGAELSLAESSTRGALQRVVSKLGLRTSAQLPLLWHTLGEASQQRRDGAADVLTFESDLTGLLRNQALSEGLTPAERELLHSLLQGDSNLQIAQRRRVSTQTIANQLAVLFRKRRVHSRAELIVSVLSAPDGTAGTPQNDPRTPTVSPLIQGCSVGDDACASELVEPRMK